MRYGAFQSDEVCGINERRLAVLGSLVQGRGGGVDYCEGRDREERDIDMGREGNMRSFNV